MRILMVLESDFPPDIRVENELIALSEAGHEAHIACYSRSRSFPAQIHNQYTIHKKYIPEFIYKSSVGALKFGFYFRFWRKFIRNLMREYSFDVIHIHDLPLAKIGLECSIKYKMHYILDLHENWPALLDISTHTKTLLGRILCSIKQWEEYERIQVPKADRIIVVVEEARERLKNLGVPSDKIHIVSNTLNIELFDFPEPEKDPNYITLIYGGGIHLHRGIQTVLQALPELRKHYPKLRFLIAGSGNFQDALEIMVQELGLAGNVQFLGWVSQKEMIALMHQSDYAVIPHMKSPHSDATIPHKLFQYIFAGLPVIASNCEPLERILEETNMGVTFTHSDPKSFAEAFHHLYRNIDFHKGIYDRGQYWVREKYNWKQNAEVLLNLYAKL